MKIKNLICGLLLVVPLLTTLPGCKKFLDRKPLDATLNDLNGGGIDGQILGLYSALRGDNAAGFNTIPWLAMHSFRDDDAIKGSSSGDGSDWAAIFDQFQYTKNHWSNDQYWADHYGFLGKVNTALQTADSLGASTDREIINVGEAKFFRAFAYFDLVRVYGEVPKIDFRTYTTDDANVAKSNVNDIYALIDADLTDAEQKLPVSWEATFPGRLTKYAAMTLHAKTYLYRQQWSQALSLCNDVIASGKYNLHADYFDMFSENGELCDESIFEIQAKYTGPSDDNNALWNYSGSQGTRGSGDWNLGWGWNAPSQKLATSTYEPNDPRRAATILFSGQSDGTYGKILPAYDANSFPQPYWNKKIYTNPALRASSGDQSGGWVNHRVLRYADVLLMAAEAANETGDLATAKKWVDTIRHRARTSAGGNDSYLPAISASSQAAMRTAIQQERHVEFAMEGERFFDLVRWGLANTVLGPLGYTTKNKYYPLPQGVIDASSGVLVQNPDY